MLENLEKKLHRFEELQHLVADPKVIANNLLYQRYAKELSGLSNVVDKYNLYKKISAEIKDIEEMLKSKGGHDKDFLKLASEELEVLRNKHTHLKDKLQELLLEEDPDADKNVIMEIRAGTGGLEASLFAADLFRMYSRYAANNGWKADVISTSPTEAGGFKEIIFSVSGQDVFKKLKYERGTHRVQRVPATEASGRIHTSAVTVAVLPEVEEAELEIDTNDLRIDVYRSTGKGGQGVNTTDSAVRITYIPTGMVVTCQDERSQLKNKIKAMRVLRARLQDSINEEKQEKIAMDRKLQVGSGDRSEKIRTYNFPDRRITDHRIGLTLHKLEAILEGGLDDLISPLILAERKERLQLSQ